MIEGALWKYQGTAAWYFLSTTKAQGVQIKAREKRRLGWGSMPVRVTIGQSTWDTSIFPSKEGSYLLPVKASVRKAEMLEEGTRVRARCIFRSRTV
ncbi:MAG: DUF1905 domain-containing protein [Patescibacteria group bacterium]